MDFLFPKSKDYKPKFEPLVSERSNKRFFETFIDLDAPEGEVHPNPIPLGGGCPDEGFFPVESIHVNLVDEPFQHLKYDKRAKGTNDFDINVDEQEHKLNAEHTSHSYRYALNENQLSIAEGFQYGGTDGFKPLKKFSKDLITKLFKPAYDDYEVIVSNGSGDSLFKVCDLLCEEGGSILVEEFTFTVFNTTVKNYGCTPVPVKLNIREGEPGIDTEYLDDLLTNWASGPYKHLKKPTALYTIPTGQNPTGLTQSLEIRKKVYALAEKHDFVILEDDPYGYLVLPKYGTANIYESPDFNVDQFAKSLTPSYLTIDTAGRVLRLDTYSKLFAPGLRLSFITGNPFLIHKIFIHTCLSTRCPSGVSQVLLTNAIESMGGIDGWLAWCAKVAKHYTIRRDVFLDVLYGSKAAKAKQISVVEPDAGMFIIVYINFEEKVKDPKDYAKLLLKLKAKFLKHGADVVFGNRMVTDLSFPSTTKNSNFIRLTTAAAHTNEILAEGAKRFCDATYEFFEDLNAGKYDDLINA